MGTTGKIKKRGFVMTGGGAKGLYEAGVIHAFHITGMEFDVITGSSIGAMNSVFFAEYLYHKRKLDEVVRNDPNKAIEAMDHRVKAFHHAWLMMPDKRVIDDSPQGPLGKLKDDLLQFDLSLPQLTQLGWWWTDPQRGLLPEKEVVSAGIKLVKELIERLGGLGQALQIVKDARQAPLQGVIRAYLRRFNMDRSLIPPQKDGKLQDKLQDIFTTPVSPLRLEHLVGDVGASDVPGEKKYPLVDLCRTLRDYAEQGIEVRLTRANFRTGRLEISAYVPAKKFVRFMQSQVWRLQKEDPDKIPLGSFRLQLPGNPKAINAALCSGRFPGVFIPYPIADLYPQNDPENTLLYLMLSGWLDDPQVEAVLEQAYQELHPQAAPDSQNFAKLFNSWCKSEKVREFFPQQGDTYVDGGAIDNTPSNSAVDFAREWADENDRSKRDVVLELFIIFLGVEPMIQEEHFQDPNLYQVVKRTLDIVGVAKQTSDANTVDTINRFGQRGENLGRALQLVLERYREDLAGLDSDQKRRAEERLREMAKQSGPRGFWGEKPEGILERLAEWADKQIGQGLPLHVEEVKIYPEKMPLDTLQFTERLGYRKENAIQMLTMGCYNTLWALRVHLEKEKTGLDERDQQVLALTSKWMGIDPWPDEDDPAAQDAARRRNWRCQRTACVFHAQHCRHGVGSAGHPRA